MVFVMVGTQKQDFSRIFRLVENAEVLKDEMIVAQSGYTKYDFKRTKAYEFMSHDELVNNIKKADIIICHGGVGTIFDSLYENKKILAVPRLAKYGEHINDHQIEICEALSSEGYIEYLSENDNINDKIKLLKEKEYKKYVSNNDYLHILKQEI